MVRFIPNAGALAMLCLCLAACGGGGSSGDSAVLPGPGTPDGDPAPFSAEIRTTSFGIPHIQADNYGGLGYGLGYVQARDNLCVLAEEFLTIRGQRAEFFGRDGGYEIPANGSFASNVNSDFFWRFIVTGQNLQSLLDNLSPEAREASRGYAAGFSRYVQELQSGEHAGRHMACRDADWVTPITEADMYRRYFRLAILASSSVLPTEIATAAPPGLDDLPLGDAPLESPGLTPEDLPFGGELPIGSNMYAIAAGASQTGQSISFSNPHFPWVGSERLYQFHLTLPGELDIFGASLLGVPAALIGFNENLAWSHTVSTAFRFGLYELTLNPVDPTQYFYDGQLVDMESESLTIDILESDGSVSQETRTLYRSRYGPMLELAVEGIPVLPWTVGRAYTLRDANAENDRLIEQYFQWNRAESLQEFIELQGSVLGVPWVNTTATSPSGDAYYADVTVVPNVPDSKVQSCPATVAPALALLMPGLPVLDGSRAACNWDTDPDAPAPGIFGPGNLPSQIRQDYVTNCNDSYWLGNPREPLTGFARIIGDEQTERSLRTRLCLLHAEERLSGADAQTIGNVVDGLAGNTGFTVDNLQDIALASHIYSARLARDDVVSNICNNTGMVLSSSGLVDATLACEVLANWDLASNLDSVGAHLWREFFTRADDTLLGLWLTPFNANDPLNTPRDLNTANLQVQMALGDAINRLNEVGIAPDTPFGQVQYSGIHGATGDNRIPIFGDLGNPTGSFTVVGRDPIDATGLPVVRGNSYLHTVTWDSSGNPLAEGFLTYSQSTDPASPHFRDQTERYSAKQWIKYPFTEEEIQADENLTVEQLTQ
ncbi:MAG: hypothetical protein CMN28_15510 [Salinisphaeraceae bacterium]|nr:hypothetical protein [Salinisphaeraceae bacterium]